MFFFGLSGFLVCGSFSKHPDLKFYLKSRAKRILPPYLFIVLSCAFGLAAVSSLSLVEYYTAGGFWKYLVSNICFLNFIQPSLPGVFDNSVTNAVNGSLWTLKVEWALYLSIPVFFWFVNKFKWNIPLAVVTICICSFAYSLVMEYVSGVLGSPLYYKLSYQFIGQLSYFFTGVLVYHFRERLSNHEWWKMLAIAFFLYGLIEIDFWGLDFTYVSFICQMLLVFGTLLFSLSRPITRHSSKLGNVSYEMYLFHFPVMQLALHFGLNQYLSISAAFAVVLLAIVCLSVIFQKTYNSFAITRKRA